MSEHTMTYAAVVTAPEGGADGTCSIPGPIDSHNTWSKKWMAGQSIAFSVFVYPVDRPSQRIERRETARAKARGSEHRNGKCFRGGVHLVLLAFLGACTAPAGGPGTVPVKSEVRPKASEQKPRAESHRTVVLPGIVVDLETGEVQLEGQVCLTEGILEYVAVAEGGKEYESIFSLKCRPSHLHVALLIAGFQPGEVTPEARGDFSPQADPAANNLPPGAPEGIEPPEEYWARSTTVPTYVSVEVDVQQPDDSRRRRPVEDFLIDRRTGRSPERLAWVFTGSFFYRDRDTGVEVFAADLEKSLIALWYDPAALLNLTRNVGNPYRGDDMGLKVDIDTLPERGTPVRLILLPVSSDSR